IPGAPLPRDDRVSIETRCPTQYRFRVVLLNSQGCRSPQRRQAADESTCGHRDLHSDWGTFFCQPSCSQACSLQLPCRQLPRDFRAHPPALQWSCSAPYETRVQLDEWAACTERQIPLRQSQEAASPHRESFHAVRRLATTISERARTTRKT